MILNIEIEIVIKLVIFHLLLWYRTIQYFKVLVLNNYEKYFSVVTNASPTIHLQRVSRL